MTGGRKRLMLGLMMTFFLALRLGAQDLCWDDSVNSLVLRPVIPKTPRRFSLCNEFSYSISVSGYYCLNGPEDKTTGQMAFLHSLKYKFGISSKRFHLTNDLVHMLGLVYYFDSISKFQTDENTLTTRISCEIVKRIQLSVSSVITTRIFNSWDVAHSPGGGPLIKTISSSFLTPLICNFSGGLGINLMPAGMLDIGISSAKLTYIRDRGIFDKTGLDSFYGIEKGRNYSLEYGISLHLIIDWLIFKKIQWNCDMLLFKGDKSSVDMTFKNLFAYRINRFLKTSLQTRVFYNEDVSRRIRMESLLSFGFDFHL
ncbi:MAG: hypothetical protein NTW31_07755 [Bacteroidetes bacterium]|nr:hypothetical protein [Bacteroidota bacterium]